MKLLVSDFDGTYYTNETDIYLNNKSINNWIDNHNIFMLSSGRSFKSLKEMTKKYNINYQYLSCCDGSILYDKNDKIIIKYPLNPNIINKFLNLKNYAKIERIQFSYPDDYYSKKKDDELIGLNLVIKNEYVTEKFLKEFNLLKDKYQEFDFLAYSHDEITFFCLKNKGINKSSTIKYLQDKLNLNYHDIYVFGDNQNDYEMLKHYQGYYIGNANSDIKNICIKGFNNIYEFFNDDGDDEYEHHD